MRKSSRGGPGKRERAALEPGESGEALENCLDAAIRFLGYRPRSEQEVRQRLLRRGFEGEMINTTIARLKERNLLDDRSFAEFWKEDRDAFNPRSRWLIKQELRQKGVTGDVIEQVIGALDDEDSAYRAASDRARSLSRSDYETFRRRLGEYLKRRGFGYTVANRVVEQVWRDTTPSEPTLERSTPDAGMTTKGGESCKNYSWEA
ncbi:MAG: regulatory protein RecX [Dehalococcoidia bacterium]|nr:regulatory protein RecX [Dehalococcoidia bacterium]